MRPITTKIQAATLKYQIILSMVGFMGVNLQIFSQQSFDFTNEFFNVMTQHPGGFSIGNACGDPYMEVENFGDLDMNFEPLEILSAKITIYGNVINLGTITYLCDNSIFELSDETLTVTTTNYTTLQVYPNPANNWLKIQGVEVSSLKLLDINGRAIKEYKTMGTSHLIYMDNVVPGMYFLIINNTIIKKILKQ